MSSGRTGEHRAVDCQASHSSSSFDLDSQRSELDQLILPSIGMEKARVEPTMELKLKKATPQFLQEAYTICEWVTD
jgi:hypothetical protein